MTAKQRLMMFLIDPDLPSKDFEELATWLQSSDIRSRLKLARRMREDLYELDARTQEHSDKIDRTQSEVQLIEELSRQIAERLHPLSLESPVIVLNTLAKKLKLPMRFTSRIPFSEGINKLISRRSHSEILTAVEQFRNELTTNQHTSEWPLQEKPPNG